LPPPGVLLALATSEVSVREAFEELVKGVLETPSLLAETSGARGRVRLNKYSGNKGSCAC
jgi:Ras-related protein Rab-18